MSGRFNLGGVIGGAEFTKTIKQGDETPEQLVKLEGEFEIEVKRFYFPFVFNVKCPHCGEKCEKDFSDQYLSYPTINKEENIYFYCNNCDGEFEVGATLEIGIKTDMKKTKKL